MGRGETWQGTSHFTSLAAAAAYYGTKGNARAKVNEGAISIGQPPAKLGFKLRINDEGRYGYVG